MSDYREAIDFFTVSLEEYLPEKLVVNRIKALVGWISKGLPGGAALRREVYASSSLPEVRQVFESYFAVSAPSFTAVEDSLASALD